MRFIKRMTAVALTLAMVMGAVITAKPSEAAEEFTEAQALEAVKAAIEKHKTHSTVAYTLDSSDSWSFYAYDTVNRVGAVLTGVDAEYFNSRETGLDDELDWMDFKNKIYYEGYYNDNDELAYSFDPIDDEDVEDYIEYYFKEILNELKDGFPMASTYQYMGIEWVIGPDDQRNRCYVFDVPESDPSLYSSTYSDLEEDPYYMPIAIYIGVDDGEIYRIDEQRYFSTSMDTEYVSYHTFFEYPEKLEVPESVKKNARLSDEYEIYDKGIEYYVRMDDDYNATDNLYVYGFSGDAKKSQKKNIKFPDTLKVLGNVYKVQAISYNAFVGEKSIRTVKLGKNIEEIGEASFNKCINMKSFSFAKSKVSLIKKKAFYECKSLKELDIPKIKVIGARAFMNCRGLKKVTLGKKINKIGKDAFKGTSGLETLIIKNKKMKKYADSSKGREELGLSRSVVVK